MSERTRTIDDIVYRQLTSHSVIVAWADEPQSIGQDNGYPAGRYADAFAGFLLRVRDDWFLVTAGHVLDDLARPWASHRRPVAMSMVDGLVEEKTGSDQFPIGTDTRRFVAINTDEGIDFGLIPLNALEIALLSANGKVPVTRELISLPAPQMNAYLLWGVPRDGAPPQETCWVKCVDTPDGPRFAYSVRSPIMRVRPQDPPARMRRAYPELFMHIPRQFEDSTGQQFQVDSIVGTSGGPLWGADLKNHRYWLVGVQSRWDAVPRILAANPIAPIYETIERFIERHSSAA